MQLKIQHVVMVVLRIASHSAYLTVPLYLATDGVNGKHFRISTYLGIPTRY